jgi:hypothetical protein
VENQDVSEVVGKVLDCLEGAWTSLNTLQCTDLTLDLANLHRYSTRGWKNLYREMPEQEKRVEALTGSVEPLSNRVSSLAPQTTNEGETMGLRSALSESLLRKIRLNFKPDSEIGRYREWVQ